MSEGHDREVLALLDRAAAGTPPLHLARKDVVARGQQIVRRRRATAAGMGISGLALAGVVWAGLGGPGMLGSTQVTPAGTTSQTSETTQPGPGGADRPEDVEGVDEASPGSVVTLLGEDYTVGVDPLGWPQLIADDGSVFLRVTDEHGPSAGGMVDMTRWHWPWQPEESIHFAVEASGGHGVLDGEVVEQVTIVGPEGKVFLTSISE